VPDAWVWIAEVESSMNPAARSPAGAVGLFQLMPATARHLGLRPEANTDERLDPLKNADAAARYLRHLHRRFRSWPLTLAAYNAGEGRVSRLLRETGRADFEAIRDRLPLETRMYVPRVIETVRLREGIDPAALPAPRGG
jgi:membrane-bound lytic murein transglycosylase D